MLGKQLEKIVGKETTINKAMADFAENFKEKNEQYKFLQDRID